MVGREPAVPRSHLKDVMEELTIKVPAPFSGVSDLGFTARYPSQERYSASPDVPFLFEGSPQPLKRLLERLRMLRQGSDRPYAWTDPVMLSDQVVVMAFRDRSLENQQGFSDFVENSVRPAVFPFLRDCVTLAGLRLEELISIHIEAQRKAADFEIRLEEIVQPNGQDLLWSF